MTRPETGPETRLRRPPPDFRLVTVTAVTPVGTRLTRVTLRGDGLDGFPVPEPAASVRVLLPRPGDDTLALPEWNGNEFLLADGRRPAIRTFTPGRFDPTARELDIDVVLHDVGVASDWARRAAPGMYAAVSGPGRGYRPDATASDYLIGGDETAVPAIRQLLEVLPDHLAATVHLEAAHPDGRTPLPEHPRSEVVWHDLPEDAPPGDALVSAITSAPVGGTTRVWVAGEAAAVQRIRRVLLEERSVPRARTTIRGYWKHGRAGVGTEG